MQRPKMRFDFLISENTTSQFLANEKIYSSDRRFLINDLIPKF